jgi:cytidine deaminase
MTDDELIKVAENVLNPYTTKEGRLFGDVGATLLSESGKLYTGVCVDTPSWGLCAERSAIAAMITNKEYRIKKIVVVWRDPKDGKLYALAPCGVCREFMCNIDAANMEADFIIGKDKTPVKIKDLLPYHEWPEPLN